jgi:hypothetical protein
MDPQSYLTTVALSFYNNYITQQCVITFPNNKHLILVSNYDLVDVLNTFTSLYNLSIDIDHTTFKDACNYIISSITYHNFTQVTFKCTLDSNYSPSYIDIYFKLLQLQLQHSFISQYIYTYPTLVYLFSR